MQSSVSSAIINSIKYIGYEIGQQFTLPVIIKLCSLFSFSFACSSFFTFLLKICSFEYAKKLTNNWIVTALLFILCLYIEVWNVWKHQLIYLNHLCSVFISLYAYDCCCNIADYCVHNIKRNNQALKQTLLLVSAFLFVIFLGLLIYLDKYKGILIKHLPTNSNITSHVIIILLVMIVISIIRFRHAINLFLIGSMMISLILMRYYLIAYSNDLLNLGQLPFESIPLIMMAFDAQAKQSKRDLGSESIGNSSFSYLLRSCVGFYIYSVINERYFSIQIIFGLLSIILLALNK